MPLMFCPNIVATGTCGVPDCRGYHAIRKCPCGVVTKLQDYQAHLRGRRHKENLIHLQQPSEPQSSTVDLASQRGELKPSCTTDALLSGFEASNTSARCDVCLINFNNQSAFETHIRTQAHRNAVTRSSERALVPRNPEVRGQPAAPGYLLCNICNRDVHLDVWISHTARHTSDQQRDEIDAAVDESGKDKDGVSVSYKDGVDFGIIDPAEALRKDVLRTADVVISRAEDAVPVGLYSYRLSSSPRGDNYGTKSVRFLHRQSSYPVDRLVLQVLCYPTRQRQSHTTRSSQNSICHLSSLVRGPLRRYPRTHLP